MSSWYTILYYEIIYDILQILYDNDYDLRSKNNLMKRFDYSNYDIMYDIDRQFSIIRMISYSMFFDEGI